MRNRNPWVVFFLFLAAGCAASSSQLVPMPAEGRASTPENSVIYLFRTPGSLSPQAPLDIQVDGREVGSLYGGSYLCFEVAPGVHQVRMELSRGLEKNLVGTDFGDVKPGRVFYGEIDFPVREGRRPKLTRLEERDGKARVAGMTPAKVK